MRKVLFYETLSGKCPVEEFLDTLSPKHAQKVTWVLNLVEELPSISTKYFKKLVKTNEIWEVRVTSGKNNFRLLGFFDGPKLVVLNHAFQKKTQKLPRAAIELAEARKKEYNARRK